MRQADVSVIIPTVDRPELLGVTLRSVLAQTVRPREIVVVDNGDNPGTEAVVRAAGAIATYLKIPPLGLQAARNAGIAQATGRWIALLDDDDLMEPEYLEAAMPAMADERVDMIGTDHLKFEGDVVDEQTNFQAAPPGYWQGIPRPEAGSRWSYVGAFPLVRLFQRNPIYPSTIIIRKSLVQAIGGYDPRVRPISTEDIEFLVRALAAARLALVWEPLVLYRRHAGSMSYGAMRARRGRWQIFQFVRDHVTGLPPAFVAALDADLIGRRKQLFGMAFREQMFDAVREVGSRFGREEWTPMRRAKYAIAGLPRPLARFAAGAAALFSRA